jgi:hypothetical protein
MPAKKPEQHQKSPAMFIVEHSNDDDFTFSRKELTTIITTIRNTTLQEVLSSVTELLEVGGDLKRELALISVLRKVNNMQYIEVSDDTK